MAYGTAPTSGGTGDAITTDTIATIDGGGGTFGEAQIVKVAYGATGDANVVSATQPFPISLAASTFVFSTVNTSVAQLAAGASFTGTIEAIPNQPAVSVLLASDQPIILFVEQFIDAAGVFAAPIIYTNPTMIAANAGTSFSFPANGNYIRIRARNAGGATTTTFNINTAFGNLMPATAKGNLPTSINEIGGTVVTGTLPVTLSAPDIGLTVRDQTIQDAQTGAYPLGVTLKGDAGGPLDGVALLDELVQGNFQIPVKTPDIAKDGLNAGLLLADSKIFTVPVVSAPTAGTVLLIVDTTGYNSITVSADATVSLAVAGSSSNVQTTPSVSWTATPGFWVSNGSAQQVGNTGGSTVGTALNQNSGNSTSLIFPVVGRYFKLQVVSGAGPVTLTVALRTAQAPLTFPVNTQLLIAAGQGVSAGTQQAAISGGGILTLSRARTTLTSVLGDNVGSYPTLTNTGATVVEKHAVPELTWNYAPPAAGLLNTTVAVTVKAAVAAQRGNISTMDLWSEALTTATEFAIRDGAAGTVLYRTKIATGGLLQGRHVIFDPPLRQAAVNTLIEIVTLTASGAGAVYCNLSGFMSN